jgi:DNA invertase Pin-like site-specific DNA recombinase
VAEQEARAISDRTKAALAVAKARGVRLGMANPRIAKHMDQAVSASVATRTGKADTFAANVLPLIERLQAGGASLRSIAADLNERNVKTARGGLWHAATVRNVLAR